MDKNIILNISKKENVTVKQVEVVLRLLSEGNTIPFIARYRKEATNNLDENKIKNINDVYIYQENLLKRKEAVIKLIAEKDMLTDELRNAIMECEKLVDIEDLYRPYKEKKKTKASEAIALGMEGLAKEIMQFPINGNINTLCIKYLNNKVKTIDKALELARYIISEYISDNAVYRKEIRKFVYFNGQIISKKKPKSEDTDKVYEMYYNYNEDVSNIKPHRVLAINRGEKEKILNVSIDVDKNKIIDYLKRKVIKNNNSFVCREVILAIEDSIKRLIYPSIEREIRASLSEKAENDAIENFSKNVENLLLTPPIKEKVVLGYDPAFRTGCKLAVLDKTGKVLDISVIYPTEPHNKIKESEEKVLELIDKYNIDIIAIGNGTASRESESFIANVIKKAKRKVEYIIVSEAGASVYSASKEAIKEFPNLTVEKRSAISIGRRLQDALSELVKIDPKSIGVGLYQHDISSKKLDDSLDFVVSKTVNQVGVNINTASPSLLKYVSGLNKKVIDKIIEYRDHFGKILSRVELSKIKGVTPKVFEQCAGFMRIIDGDNLLDRTAIHPDNYNDAINLLNILNLNIKDIGTDKIKKVLLEANKDELKKKLQIDNYTLEDIIKNLQKPNRDPRDNMPRPILRNDILHIEDLHIGDTLQGTIRNVVDFGAFVDIGLKNDGLIHISKMADKYIKHPSEILNVGDIIDCKVIDVNLEKKKVSLSLIK